MDTVGGTVLDAYEIRDRGDEHVRTDPKGSNSSFELLERQHRRKALQYRRSASKAWQCVQAC